MASRGGRAGFYTALRHCLFATLGLGLLGGAAAAQNAPAETRTSAGNSSSAAVAVPSFWDPRRRLDRPDLPSNTVVRFLTELDYPPFNYAGPDGNPAGFNVDLARSACEELRLACTVQMRRFDTLLEALAENRGDAVVASLAATPENRRRADFTDPYYRSPARFVAKKDANAPEPNPEKLQGTRIAVVSGTAHEAYLKTLFGTAELRPFPDAQAARQALRRGEVDLLFGDGTQLAFWLNGSDSEACCVFHGGAFTENRYFGEGMGIAVRRGNESLRQALNWALFRLWENGRYTELWLRYFPISPY